MLIFVHDLQEAQAAAGGDAATEETSLPAPTGPVSHSDALAHLSLREKKAAGEEVTAEEAGEGAVNNLAVKKASLYQLDEPVMAQGRPLPMEHNGEVTLCRLASDTWMNFIFGK